MLKVAIDSGPLTSGDSVRGIGVYVRELIDSLKKLDLDISTVHGFRFTDHYDIIHFTSFNPYFISVPYKKPIGTKFILTIYDLIPLVYPKQYPSGVKGWLKWQINKLLIHKNVDAIITISETSKKDICRFLKIDPKKVFVTYLAPRSVTSKLKPGQWIKETKRKYNLPDKFALYVGDVNYNKNIPNLISGCKLAGVPLVIVGKQALNIENLINNAKTLNGPMDLIRRFFKIPHPELMHYDRMQKSFRDNENIVRLGFVKDVDVNKIFNLASIYIQASFYEGFCLPLVEAFEVGAPIVVSKNQCHVEILGDDFNYFDPNNPMSIASGLQKPNINRKLKRSYSWQKTANDTLNVYSKV